MAYHLQPIWGVNAFDEKVLARLNAQGFIHTKGIFDRRARVRLVSSLKRLRAAGLAKLHGRWRWTPVQTEAGQ